MNEELQQLLILICSSLSSDLHLMSNDYPVLANTSIDDIKTDDYQAALTDFTM